MNDNQNKSNDNPFKGMLDRTKIPYFICIGSTNHSIDCMAPLIGSLLERFKYNVKGTYIKPVHAANISSYKIELHEIEKNPLYQTIYIDTAFMANNKNHVPVCWYNGAFKPGAGLGKRLGIHYGTVILINPFYDKLYGNFIRKLTMLFKASNVKWRQKSRTIASDIYELLAEVLEDHTDTKELQQLALKFAHYYLTLDYSMGEMADHFETSKSTISRHLKATLSQINYDTYVEVLKKVAINKK